MRLEHYPEEKLKKEILDIVGRHLDLNKYKVFFFGSRVNGKGDERSDIDVGIEGAEAVPYRIFSEIEEEIENIPSLYKIELVDFRSVDEKFKEVALQHIEILNSK